ncbi:multiprotein-bridging factor 1 family protein [Streptomyces sp. NPDC048282]|uniref:helix-turn-helix domain-containing protein n=1 Tax=Streptomyces sp. NPDC048282 TaxID=3365528 RepID=UPI003712D1C4
MRSDDGSAPETGPGGLARRIREERRLSREAVAARAGVSAQDLERFEADRLVPDRSVLLRLAELLGLSLRDRNELLARAGHGRPYDETPLAAPEMAAFRTLVGNVLRSHGAVPAMAVDQSGRLLAVNAAADLIVDVVAPADRTYLTEAGVRTHIHPDCLDKWTLDSSEWTGHVLRGDLQDRSAAPQRFSLLRITVAGQNLAFVNVETVFALPLNITVEEVAIQAFFPADEETASFLR